MPEFKMKQKIKELFRETDADSILLRTFSEIHDPMFYYFTNLRMGCIDNTFLILKKAGKPIIMTSILEYELVKNTCKNFSVKKYETNSKFADALKKELGKCKRIGINEEIYSKKMFSRLRKYLKKPKFFDVSKKLYKLRTEKTPDEIRKIKKACVISEKVANKISSIYSRKMTEQELALEIDYALKKKGAENIAFPTIVASGKNSAVPHHIPGNKKIGKGILLLDFGAKYENYCADITRMFYIGKANKHVKSDYESLYSAKKEIENLIVSGEASKKIHLEAEKIMKKNTGFNFVHALGHGLGIEVHDAPGVFGKKTKWKVSENMVFAVEPAIYHKKYGIRIEDDLLVKRNRIVKLTNAPKKLTEL